MSNECFSCKRHRYCIIKRYGNVYLCPCILCLVKPMCSHICDERNTMLNDVKDYKAQRFGRPNEETT